MKRTKHNLSNYKLLTCDMGQLIPCGLTECLPGDTIQQSSSILLRFSPLIVPVMHPVQVRIHHFFVPHRLVYDGWEDFITGGPTGTGSAIPLPTNAALVNSTVGSLYDYLGLPVGSLGPTYFSLMAIRAYNKIYNEFYRDEDLATTAAQDSGTIQRIAWQKDYFTTARPWTQKGPAVTLPLGTSAPVTQAVVSSTGSPTFTSPSGLTSALSKALNSQTVLQGNNSSPAGNLSWVNPALSINAQVADLTAATAAQINDLRRALALQRYQEARAQYGSRYTEYLRYLGVRSADQRLDRPEYLGGGKQTVAFSEVLRTGSDTAASPIGDLKGHGISALRSNRYRYFCEEHGYIMSLLSIRPKTMYTQGIPKTFVKRSKEEYYQKELEQIGQQPIVNAELYTNNTATDWQYFGYSDRYAEYRSTPSSIAGEFRNTLNFWHMGRVFGGVPTLNQSFTDCDPGRRNFAVQTNHVCWVMVNHDIQARRMLGNNTIGRIL